MKILQKHSVGACYECNKTRVKIVGVDLRYKNLYLCEDCVGKLVDLLLTQAKDKDSFYEKENVLYDYEY